MGLKVHPLLNVPEFMEAEDPHPEIVWVIKHMKLCGSTPEQMAYAEMYFHFFRSDGQPDTAMPHDPSNVGRILDWVRVPTEDYFYQWSSIAQTGASLANFMRTLALLKEVEHWSMTTLREKLVKIGAQVVRHGRYVTFQLAEVAVPRGLFEIILRRIDELRPPTLAAG